MSHTNDMPIRSRAWRRALERDLLHGNGAAGGGWRSVAGWSLFSRWEASVQLQMVTTFISGTCSSRWSVIGWFVGWSIRWLSLQVSPHGLVCVFVLRIVLIASSAFQTDFLVGLLVSCSFCGLVGCLFVCRSLRDLVDQKVIGMSCRCRSQWLVSVDSLSDVSCLPLYQLVGQVITYQWSIDNWLVIWSPFWCWVFFLHSKAWLVRWLPL